MSIFFECVNEDIVIARNLYLPEYQHDVSLFKFYILMGNLTNENIVWRVYEFVKIVFKTVA